MNNLNFLCFYCHVAPRLCSELKQKLKYFKLQQIQIEFSVEVKINNDQKIPTIRYVIK